MLTQGNYKVKSSRLIVGEDGSTQLELTLHGYPTSFTALFELVPVQSEEDRLEAAIRKMCINYLMVKFQPKDAEYFIEHTDTTPERWLDYVAVNAQTDKPVLQRGDLMLDVIMFLERES